MTVEILPRSGTWQAYFTTTEEVRAAREFLRNWAMRLGYDTPVFRRNRGICSNLRVSLKHAFPLSTFQEMEELVGWCARSWAGWSGHGAYPVPGPEGQLPWEAFDHFETAGDLWGRGPYPNARRELCDHIAKCLEVMLRA